MPNQINNVCLCMLAFLIYRKKLVLTILYFSPSHTIQAPPLFATIRLPDMTQLPSQFRKTHDHAYSR